MTPPGRPKYTDEPVMSVTAMFLTEAVARWREDAATEWVTMGAIQIELSRLYLDPDIRAEVLRAVRDRLGRG